MQKMIECKDFLWTNIVKKLQLAKKMVAHISLLCATILDLPSWLKISQLNITSVVLFVFANFTKSC
jgi:hypothetical protein